MLAFHWLLTSLVARIPLMLGIPAAPRVREVPLGVSVVTVAVVRVELVVAMEVLLGAAEPLMLFVVVFRGFFLVDFRRGVFPRFAGRVDKLGDLVEIFPFLLLLVVGADEVVDVHGRGPGRVLLAVAEQVEGAAHPLGVFAGDQVVRPFGETGQLLLGSRRKREHLVFVRGITFFEIVAVLDVRVEHRGDFALQRELLIGQVRHQLLAQLLQVRLGVAVLILGNPGVEVVLGPMGGDELPHLVLHVGGGEGGQLKLDVGRRLLPLQRPAAHQLPQRRNRIQQFLQAPLVHGEYRIFDETPHPLFELVELFSAEVGEQVLHLRQADVGNAAVVVSERLDGVQQMYERFDRGRVVTHVLAEYEVEAVYEILTVFEQAVVEEG